MKRVFGLFEAVFDGFYMIAALVMGIRLLTMGSSHAAAWLAGMMALVLVGGDSFHLVPRIMVILTKQEERFRAALGRGKQITSITMTVFYLILWQIGLVLFSPQNIGIWTVFIYLLAVVRILLCLLPQNRWLDRFPPVKFGILRNIPFFLMGIMVAVLFYLYGRQLPGIGMMWLAVVLSFGFYLPVVLWSNQNSKIGMLMLPKTCAYLWMMTMCLSL